MKKTTFRIDQQRCTFCGGCSAVCPVMAIDIQDNAGNISDRCIACNICVQFCPVSAIEPVAGNSAGSVHTPASRLFRMTEKMP